MDEPTTLRVRVYGRTLAANLRSAIQRQATQLKLCGYVEALPDRSLEVAATGTREALDSLLTFLADQKDETIESLDISWDHAPVRESRFTIRYGA